MTAPAKLPSLFGRFTAILQDHEHLGTTLKELRAMCISLEAQQFQLPTLAPLDLLEDLRSDLSGHFAAEEADSYFGIIVQEAPLLATRIGQLKSEHALMLSALGGLCRLAAEAAALADGADPADTAALAAALCEASWRLIAELERHERAESLLLR